VFLYAFDLIELNGDDLRREASWRDRVVATVEAAEVRNRSALIWTHGIARCVRKRRRFLRPTDSDANGRTVVTLRGIS
jgi:hypothetical protein